MVFFVHVVRLVKKSQADIVSVEGVCLRREAKRDVVVFVVPDVDEVLRRDPLFRVEAGSHSREFVPYLFRLFVVVRRAAYILAVSDKQVLHSESRAEGRFSVFSRDLQKRLDESSLSGVAHPEGIERFDERFLERHQNERLFVIRSFALRA